MEEENRGDRNDIKEELRRGDVEWKAVGLTNVVNSIFAFTQLGVLLDYSGDEEGVTKPSCEEADAEND